MLVRMKSYSPALFAENALVVFLLMGFIGFPGNFSPLLGGRIAAYWSLLSEGLLLVCGTASLFLLAKRYTKRLLPIGLLLAFLLSMLAFCCSALLSANPPEALYATARFFSLSMMGLYIGISFPVKRILRIVIAAHSILLLLYAFAYITNPGLIFEGGTYFIGLYSSKNNCAYELGFSLLVCYGLLVNSASRCARVLLALYFALNAFLMMQADSLGVVLVCVVALAVAELCRRSSLKPRFGSLFLLVNVAFVLIVWGVLPLMGELLADLGKDTTLTGRTYVWSVLLDMIQNSHTVFGYGYTMFWNHSPELSYWYQAEVQYGLGRYTGAHNLAIELLLNVGIVGTVSFFALVFIGLNGSKHLQRSTYAFGLAYVLYYSIKGLVERTSNISYDLLFLFIVMGLIIAAMDATSAHRQSTKRFSGRI